MHTASATHTLVTTVHLELRWNVEAYGEATFAKWASSCSNMGPHRRSHWDVHPILVPTTDVSEQPLHAVSYRPQDQQKRK